MLFLSFLLNIYVCIVRSGFTLYWAPGTRSHYVAHNPRQFTLIWAGPDIIKYLQVGLWYSHSVLTLTILLLSRDWLFGPSIAQYWRVPGIFACMRELHQTWPARCQQSRCRTYCQQRWASSNATLVTQQPNSHLSTTTLDLLLHYPPKQWWPLHQMGAINRRRLRRRRGWKICSKENTKREDKFRSEKLIVGPQCSDLSIVGKITTHFTNRLWAQEGARPYKLLFGSHNWRRLWENPTKL